jgi:2-dehydro-3-deoxy-D-arabinonate dehydratase
MKFGRCSTSRNPFQFVVEEEGRFSTISELRSLSNALQITSESLRDLVASSPREKIPTPLLLAPVSSEIEVWGAGVTYLRSRDARKHESKNPTVYERVYEADRPELFFKSTAVRVVGHGQKIGIRFDSASSIPEPEVAIVINRFKQVVGYSICNDLTARSIEGDNPLYLSQAKIYTGSTALGPDITPAWEVPPAREMGIRAEIMRAGSSVWRAETSFDELHRTINDLIKYLFRCQSFPSGVILSTGTGIVPPPDVHLQRGDIVRIEVDGVGELVNEVNVIMDDGSALEEETS